MKIGDKITFTPHAFILQSTKNSAEWRAKKLLAPEKVTGTVVYINEAHGWFRVRYTLFKTTQFECFKRS